MLVRRLLLCFLLTIMPRYILSTETRLWRLLRKRQLSIPNAPTLNIPVDFNSGSGSTLGGLGKIGQNFQVSQGFIGGSSGANVLGNGFDNREGVGLEKDKVTFGKQTGLQAAGQNIFGNSGQTSLDFGKGVVPSVCKEQKLGLLGLFSSGDTGCVDLSGLNRLIAAAGR